jgi:hypothetical protein
VEALVPSPHEYVVRRPAARAASAGQWELVDAASDTWVLRTRDPSARSSWLPLLRDGDGVAHYPTGEVTVRFSEAPSDAALRAFAKAQRVTLARRNAIEPRQAVFAPASREWLPELVERLAAAPGVARAWPVTVSRYQRV